MPIYEFQCGKCDRRFELRLRTDREKAACPGCRSRKVRRLYSVFGLNLGAAPGAQHGAG